MPVRKRTKTKPKSQTKGIIPKNPSKKPTRKARSKRDELLAKKVRSGEITLKEYAKALGINLVKDFQEQDVRADRHFSKDENRQRKESSSNIASGEGVKVKFKKRKKKNK